MAAKKEPAAQSTAVSDKKKALETAMQQIEKMYGKGSIMRYGAESALNVEAIPTGSLSLDLALGIGGLPRGRIVEIYGPESSGKTTLALHVLAEAQKMGGEVAFVDAEHALDPTYAKALGVDIVFNHADYRLMSRRALEGLAQFGEVNLFLRGIVPMIGYRTDVVYYERGERFAGESKYPLGKMLSFAVEGITSLSTKPIRMITGLGFFVFLVSLIILVYSFVRHFMGATIVGWTTLMVSVWAIGGLILLSLGVVGEYIGKIYLETKARPRFLIDEFLNEEDEE